MSNYASMRSASAIRQASSPLRQVPNPARPNPAPSPNARNSSGTTYAGMNNTRQGKFEGRSDRRWGDWAVLEFSLPLLWFDEACLAAADEGLGRPSPEMAMMDLWP